MPDTFWRYIGAALTAGGLLLGAGRYIGSIETRINQLETQQRYLHGTFTVPHREVAP